MTTEKTITSFEEGEFHFEVRQKSNDGGFTFAGYCNGKLSIRATGPDVAVRGLVRKHIAGLPDGKLIDLQEARVRLMPRPRNS